MHLKCQYCRNAGFALEMLGIKKQIFLVDIGAILAKCVPPNVSSIFHADTGIGDDTAIQTALAQYCLATSL